jgi:hypothetical protein
LHRVVWYKFTDVSEVPALMMEAVNIQNVGKPLPDYKAYNPADSHLQEITLFLINLTVNYRDKNGQCTLSRAS